MTMVYIGDLLWFVQRSYSIYSRMAVGQNSFLDLGVLFRGPDMSDPPFFGPDQVPLVSVSGIFGLFIAMAKY